MRTYTPNDALPCQPADCSWCPRHYQLPLLDVQVIASGRRKHFYLFDLAAARVERVAQLTDRAEKSLENFAVSPATGQPLVAFFGAQGYLPLVSLTSRQLVGQLKMPGSVRSATFTDDGLSLLASGRPLSGAEVAQIRL